MLLLPTAGASAQQGSVTVQLTAVNVDSWPQAQAVVTVLDSGGRPLANLAETDFQVQLNASPAPVTEVTQGVDSSLAIAVLLALDVSGSMAEGGALGQAKVAAQSFLDGLAPEDTVAVLTFNDTVDLVQPFTRDRAAAGAAIAGLQAEGATALYEATAESVALAAGADSGRRAVVLLSDGLDHGSTLARNDALLSAQRLGVPVFTIGLGDDIDRAYLRELAEMSGGRLAETATPAGLNQLYQEVGELLRGQYILTVDASTLGLVESEPATLRVEVSLGGLTTGDERAVCPQRLCVTLAQVEEGEQLAEPRTLVAEVVSEHAVTSVSFLVDDVAVLELTEPPYEFVFEPASYPDGDHTLAVEAVTSTAQTETRQVAIRTGEAAGGGISGSLLATGVIAIAIIAAVLLLLYLRRGGPESARNSELELMPNGPLGGPPLKRQPSVLLEDAPPPPPAAPKELLGHLHVTGGPGAGETYSIGGSPVSIGSGHRCLIRLSERPDDEHEIASEQARVWIRDGQLMVHQVRRLTEAGATGGGWEILTPGEAFSVGPYTFLFALADEQGSPEQPPSVPNVLKDHADDSAGSGKESASSASSVPDASDGREPPTLGSSQPASTE
ncbi:MAG: VWA domain-containing protein [Chloroflexi bacterium]|nr:VWA domain-containing protein [Chloroflexota bacterium]